MCECKKTNKSHLSERDVFDFIHRPEINHLYVTGGEPLFYMNLIEVIEEASRRLKSVAVFTSLPFATSLPDRKNVGYRVSVSDHILSQSPSHFEVVKNVMSTLSESPLFVSGWDESLKKVPTGIRGVRMPFVRDLNGYYAGWEPHVMSLQSDGFVHRCSNFEAHRYESKVL